jgi:DMSO/TMAO reductase YedYZ heme-binding membrane subunit
MLILLPFLTGVQQESGTRKSLGLGLWLFKTMHSVLYFRRYVRGQNTCDVYLVQDLISIS